MRIGIGLSMAAKAARYDSEDLAKGTLLVDFTAITEPTLWMDFTTQNYRAWDDDPTWPHGAFGVFKGKT